MSAGCHPSATVLTLPRTLWADPGSRPSFWTDGWQSVFMATSRADRRRDRAARAQAEFGRDAEAVLDVLELTEFAWHDCFGEIAPPEAVIDDVFTVAGGSLPQFVRAARLAVEDFRDLRLTADSPRG